MTKAGEHNREHADDDDSVEHRTGGNGLREIEAVTLRPNVAASSLDTNPNLTTMKARLICPLRAIMLSLRDGNNVQVLFSFFPGYNDHCRVPVSY